jgi:hypothetical protein
MQKYLRLAFGDDFRVFVSSDANSIGGGRKWFTHIIDNVKLSEVALILVSQESKSREWINFETGVAEGADILVVPVGLRNFAMGQMPYLLSGFQGRSIDDIGGILNDVAGRLGVVARTVDTKAYSNELEEAESHLVYKALRVEPVVLRGVLRFEVQNVGNVDLELLMLEAYVPRDVSESYNTIIELTSREGRIYRHDYCFSARGAYGHMVPQLRPILTPSMGPIVPSFVVPVREDLSQPERQLSIFFQLHAIGYRTEEEKRKIADIPSWTPEKR